MSQRHKVFISFHHALDQGYKDQLVRTHGVAFNGFVDRSVGDGDINPGLRTETIAQKIRDEFIRDATVTIVLVGRETWQRKHVDWEIRSSLRDTSKNSRTGLLGLVLPTYSAGGGVYEQRSTTPARSRLWPFTVPPALWKNVESGYAVMRPWPTSSFELQSWVHDAYLRRGKNPPPTLAGDRFANNRSGTRWY